MKLTDENGVHIKVDDLPMTLVFVTTDRGIKTVQTVTRKENEKRVPFAKQEEFGTQYAVCLRGKFEDILKLVEDSKRELEKKAEEEDLEF